MDTAGETLKNTSNSQRFSLIYVLVTPARNEAAFVEQTIMSVVHQTVLPFKWIIVSDGSTDGTDDIVRKYAAQHPWIELVCMPVRSERHFAGKAYAFNAGYSRVKGLNFEIIGNLDADITFEANHFEFLLAKFAEDPLLGVAGTAFVEGKAGTDIAYNYKYANIEHVSGGCQLFRRKCFEEIGGYTPIKGGGVDWTAVTTARMKGWQTKTFTEIAFIHHRSMGTGMSSLLGSRLRFGTQDYYLGSHPVWEMFRCIYQMKSRPYILGGLLLFCGYTWASLCRVERPITQELMEFRRKEQMYRLKKILCNALKIKV